MVDACKLFGALWFQLSMPQATAVPILECHSYPICVAMLYDSVGKVKRNGTVYVVL